MTVEILNNETMQLYQGDTGQSLKLTDYGEATMVQFCDPRSQHTRDVTITVSGGGRLRPRTDSG